MDETTAQIPNVGQQVDGSTDAEESQRLVSLLNTWNKCGNILLIIFVMSNILHFVFIITRT